MLTGIQIRMARGALRWSVKQLADAAELNVNTIKRMEASDGFPDARGANIQAVHDALVAAGIRFLPENGGGPGIRVMKVTTETDSDAKTAITKPARRKPGADYESAGLTAYA